MTIENMRSLGVDSVAAACLCGHDAVVDVSGIDGCVEVPALRARLRCSVCNNRPMFVRPNRTEMRAPGMGKASE